MFGAWVWGFFPPRFAEFVPGRRKIAEHGREAPRLQRGDASKGKGAEASSLLAPGKAVRGSFR